MSYVLCLTVTQCELCSRWIPSDAISACEPEGRGTESGDEMRCGGVSGVSGDSRQRPCPPESPIKAMGNGSICPNGPCPLPLPLLRPFTYILYVLSPSTSRLRSPQRVTGVIPLIRPRPPCSPPVSSPPLRASSSSNAHSRHSRPPRAPPRARVPAFRPRIQSRSPQATMTLRSPLNLHPTTCRILTLRASRLARSPIWSMEASVVDLGVFPWAHSPFLRRLSSTRFRLEGQECAS